MSFDFGGNTFICNFLYFQNKNANFLNTLIADIYQHNVQIHRLSLTDNLDGKKVLGIKPPEYQ
jgi:hypothetical protein